MGRIVLWTAGAAAFGVAALSAVIAWPVGSAPGPIGLQGNAQRGAYLARASGCIACHSNFEDGGAPLAGGAPLQTDFGTFYPPNLTTDPDHGIGDWTAESFAKAVRQGVAPDGDPYYPSFPYPFYAEFSDQQMADLWAAFQTVAPVAESAPDHDVGFPFDQRWGLKLWRAAFFYDPMTDPVPGRSEAWNRGRELVRGAAHCGACHTPRNLAGGRDLGAVFAGNPALPGEGKAPSIRPGALAEGGWTVSSLSYALKSGLTPSGDAFGGSMAEVVREGTRFLSDADRDAMATYLLEGEDGGRERLAQRGPDAASATGKPE
ncbi:c-type cytochrome [Palleronia pelagia]|uniref:Cytochrome c, mono-and diheme variants n=1 Tax=Palleronia pelagia TaxID=387096 RepID=A0A1H8BEG7_9RHOB|nr:cytochrome c [Palleronia pelagia]SEM80839.1 Cytochrome c, mono-and diheme variants [Palleronia pelagia]